MEALTGALFDQFVSGFYKAATGASSWNEALLPVQKAFGAYAAMLHSWSPVDGRLLGLHGAGGPHLDRATLDYVSRYHAEDPRKRVVVALGPAHTGKWVHCHEHLSDRFMAGNDFSQNFLVAYGIRFNSSVSFQVNDEVMTAITFELPAARGPLTEDEREFARRLGLHLQDALLAYERVRQLMQQALAGHELLDRYPYPMWLLDHQRVIAFANPAARTEEDRGERVAVRGNRIRLANGVADRRLTEILTQLGQTDHGASTQIDLRPTEADPPVWLHLSVMVPGASLGAFGMQRMVLATLFNSTQVDALDTFALARMFKLTPTEAQVAARLADGLTAEQIGEALHTAQSTVRTHIRGVLAKLNAPRIIDVVRMLHQGQALWSLGQRADRAD